MGLTRAAPTWLGWIFVWALILLFGGERILSHDDVLRAVLSGLGGLLVVGCTVWRLWSWRAVGGERRRVERVLALTHLGAMCALVLYLVSSADGMRWLGIGFQQPATEARYQVMLQVLWVVLMALSVFPLVAAQFSLRAHRHAGNDAARVEAVRVLEAVRSGLVVSLAGSALFLIGYVVAERDRTLDLSYFRTASPGTATQGMVESLEAPLQVLMFFPDVNPVQDEALRYFRALANVTGRVQIETYDRLASPTVAEAHQVTSDGTVLLVQGDQTERLALGTQMAGARQTLRRLDQEVQRALYLLLREERVAYLTTGHGELNDPGSAGSLEAVPRGRVGALRDILRYLNYDVRNLGLSEGLGEDVPQDAAFVMVLGPERPFLEEEMAALTRYLDRGGSLLLALDPESGFDMGPLEDRLGVRYVPVPLADDRQHLRQRGDLSDRRLLLTDVFTYHESVSTVALAGPGTAVFLVGPGHLEEVEGASGNPTFVVRSLPTTFADLTRDYQFSEGVETRRGYNLVAAVDVPLEDGDGAVQTEDELRPGRAMVYASSALFSDAVITSIGSNAALAADGIRWLGHEEMFAGEVMSEEDVPIVHTQAEDVVWFYAIILGAPSLFLILGLLTVYRRRLSRRGIS